MNKEIEAFKLEDSLETWENPEYKGKTPLEIIDLMEYNQIQEKRCYALFEEAVFTRDYKKASKLCNELFYKFNIDVTC